MNIHRFFSPIWLLVLAVVIFFSSFLFQGKLPIPSDTIVGLYHPFRDLYAKEYPNGIPFKNFLITDPVRQQYPWRELAVDLLKKGQLALWNPYSMAGYPLLANQQSAPLYPLNLLYFVLPFPLAWSVLVFLQPLLGGLFLYLYLRNLQLASWASLLGALVFAFSGFSVAWMEWGTVLHVGLWLPLMLLSIDKIFLNFKSNSKFKIQNAKLQFKSQKFIWPLAFVFSLSSSVLAGHLQIFFYVFVVSMAYLLARWAQSRKFFTILFVFLLFYILFFILTAIQWLPTLQLIQESARDIDRADWQQPGWFIPWQHLIQFVAPDFFGNPTTLNYWGVWNYGEFIGYVGIVPLIFALFAIFFRRDKKTLFFGIMLIFSLVFALPTLVAKLPYALNIPFISTAQPTRLLFVTDFSLAILAALGLDWFLKERKKNWYPVALIATILAGLWLFVFLGNNIVSAENLEVANRNLRLPTGLFLLSAALLLAFARIPTQRDPSMLRLPPLILCCTLVAITTFDLIRFGWKFTPFTNKEYLFPSTNVIQFLQKQEGQFRIMTTDDRILPPNFSTVYRIQAADGYDPLYLRRYGELIAASDRGEPNISPPFGFNRIITPHNYDSKIIDLLGAKYILSLTDLASPKLVKVFQEGQTRIYENRNALPRAFFVEEIIWIANKEEAIKAMFENDLRRAAIVEGQEKGFKATVGVAKIHPYTENKIVINTQNEGDGFLVLTDTFYPTWRATIDGSPAIIYRTDYNFRGLIIPKGTHEVEFFIRLL